MNSLITLLKQKKECLNMNISIFKGRNIFLVDAIGAVVSALSLLIPFSFVELFGMPKSIVSIFISIAIVYSIYSTIVYLTNPSKWKMYLIIIAILNISYCLFTVYHIFNNLNTITLLGYLYFAGEILIVLTLSIFELKLGRTKNIKLK